MALITLSAMMTDITGSIGGTTFQNTGAGLIARTKPNGRKSATMEQSLARQFPSRFIGDWWALTIAQQLAWGVYATAHPHTNRFGQVKQWSGFQCFESVNYNLDRSGFAMVSVPPVYLGAEAVDDFTNVIDNVQMSVRAVGAFTPVDSVPLIWATYYIGSSYTSNRSRYRLMGVYAYGGGAVSIDYSAEWKVKFGQDLATLPSGTMVKVIAGLQNVNTKDGTAGAILFRAGEYTAP
jgi:hypothetical protein